MTSRYYMISVKRRTRMFYIYTVCLFLLAVSIVLMPISNFIKERTVLAYIAGVLFWISAIGTIFIALKINRYRKGSYKFNEQNGNMKQFGLLHFFTNKEAIIADIGMFISIASFIIAKICTSEYLVPFIFFALFVFTFGMHCMLNGINYRYIKFYSKYVKEQKR